MNQHTNELMHIALCFDQNFWPYAQGTIKSIRSTHPSERVHIHVGHPGMDAATMSDIHSLVNSFGWEIRDYDLSDDTAVVKKYYKNSNHFNHSNFLRIFLPDRIPCEQFLYLDSDVLVNRSLSTLYRLNLNNHSIAAVPDSSINTLASKPFTTFEYYRKIASRRLKSLINRVRNKRLDPLTYIPTYIHHLRIKDIIAYPYFNSGVMVINTRAWRDKRITKKCIHFIKSNPNTLLHADQSALNSVLNNDFLPLDLKWNTQINLANIESQSDLIPQPDLIPSSQESVHIAHFVGPLKPWAESYNITATEHDAPVTNLADQLRQLATPHRQFSYYPAASEG